MKAEPVHSEDGLKATDLDRKGHSDPNKVRIEAAQLREHLTSE